MLRLAAATVALLTLPGNSGQQGHQVGTAAGGALGGWAWDWGGKAGITVGTKTGQGLCLTAPTLAASPCASTATPNGQCSTAVFSPPNDFVSAVLEQVGAQVQIGLNTEHKCNDREAWDFVLSCDGGGLYAGRGHGWKVTATGVTAAVGDTIQLRRKGLAVTFEHCPGTPVDSSCKVIHTETAAADTAALYAHVGIHNKDIEVQLCNLQPLQGSDWGWTFLLIFGFGGLAYAGGGVYVARKRSAAPMGAGVAASLKAHPHRPMWASMASLVVDGTNYTRVRMKGSRGDTHRQPSPQYDLKDVGDRLLVFV